MNSLFDAKNFLDMEIEGENSTEVIPVPPGEYIGLCVEVKAREWKARDGTKEGKALDVSWEIDDPEIKTATSRDRVVIRQGVMLETTESGAIDMSKGKNVQLGRLRAAVGMNTGGKFRFSDIVGQAATIKVTNEPQEDGRIFDRVISAAPA